MDSSCFIINEYGILKKIFSNLNNKELSVASMVSRYWKEIADITIQGNAEISCYVKNTNWPDLNSKVQPKLIIYNNDSDSRQDVLKVVKKQLPEVAGYLNKYYNLNNAFIIYMSNWKFINSLKRGKSLVTVHSSEEENSFRESLVIIPEFKDLQIDVEYFNRYMIQTMEEVHSDIVDKVKKSQCCLFISNSDLKDKVTADIIKSFCDNKQETGTGVVMAGGISNFMMSYDESSFVRIGGAVITFSGPTLSAKSFVIPYKTDLTSALLKMQEELGPLEEGYTRLAFLFTCVDRYGLYEESETEEFSKLFPCIPLFGFWSLGEFCLGYANLPNNKRKKTSSSYSTLKGEQFFFQQASTYLVITFKK